MKTYQLKDHTVLAWKFNWYDFADLFQYESMYDDSPFVATGFKLWYSKWRKTWMVRLWFGKKKYTLRFTAKDGSHSDWLVWDGLDYSILSSTKFREKYVAI